MTELDELFAKAVQAFKAGRKAEARDVFLEVVDQDEHHEQAWLYLSGLVETLEEQQICLENVLAINPNNQKAQKGLDTISSRLAARNEQRTSSEPAPDSSAFASPFSAPSDFSSLPTPSDGESFSGSSSPPIGAEFATASGDSLVGGGSSFGDLDDMTPGVDDADSELFGWLSGGTPAVESAPEAPPPDPNGPTSSVDWSPGENAPAAHGSGRQVDLPSSQEYDDWVQGLNLGGLEDLVAQPSAGFEDDEAGFVPGGPGPFGDTSFMVDSGEDVPPAADSRPDSFGGGWGDEPGTYPTDPFADGTFEDAESPVPDQPPSTFGAQAYESPDAYDASVPPAQADEGPRFGLDDDEDLAGEDLDSFWSDRLNGTASHADVPVLATPEAAPTVTAEDYYRYIPGEIEVEDGGSMRRSVLLLAAVVALAVLNVASFAYMLL